MRAWSWLWAELAAVYCVVGAFGSAAAMGWSSTAVLFGCAAAMGFLSAMTYAMVEPYPYGEWVWTGLVAGSLTLGALGTCCLVGPMGLLGILALGGTAPWTLRRLRQLVISPPTWSDVVRLLDPDAEAGEHRPEPRTVTRPTPATMTDQELCVAWRRSFVQLERARTSAEALPVVQLRARCLEELERRHPRAVRAWLASGTRASGDPTPFLETGPSVGDPPVDLG
jgi:hypothetical protein